MANTDLSLSIKLYDVMDSVGVSEKIRKLYQDTAITQNIIQTINCQIHNEQWSVFIFGSNCEGTTTEGLNSDVDTVFCDKRYPVIDDLNDAPSGVCFIIVRDDYTYDGYVKLQLVLGGTLSTYNNTVIPEDYETDNKGRICRTHLAFEQNDPDRKRKGPADAKPQSRDYKASDYVYALQCRTIPIWAREWIERRRLYHWPSTDNLKKMGDLGCFVVGVGHIYSREVHNIEWRLSFSLQERLLMFSLNSTQHKCYVLLKMIKNDIIKAEINNCITSYHCKMCLFHTIEATQAKIWRPNNLISCVRRCLINLLRNVENGVSPNYFIPADNMFNKPQFKATRNKYRLIKLLKELIADDKLMIDRLQCDDICIRVLQPHLLRNNITDTIVYKRYLNLYCAISRFSCDIYKWSNDTTVTCQIIKTLYQNLARLTNTDVLGEHKEQNIRDAIAYVIPVLHFHIAQRLASLACKLKSQEHSRQLLLYLSLHHFHHGHDADLMTSRLLEVSLLLQLEKHDLCENILEDINNADKKYSVTLCGCYCLEHAKNADLCQQLSTNNVSFKTAIRTVYVGCVRFTRSDTEIAPLPLQYEMYRSMGTQQGSRGDNNKWFDLAVVDGKIYLYFLQYLVYVRLNKTARKQAAIKYMISVLKDDLNLHHKETANNILGWVHVQEGRIPEALRCFVTSWKIRPVHNAAKWHLCIALYNYYTR